MAKLSEGSTIEQADCEMGGVDCDANPWSDEDPYFSDGS